jgi:hypothetical protein
MLERTTDFSSSEVLFRKWRRSSARSFAVV